MSLIRLLLLLLVIVGCDSQMTDESDSLVQREVLETKIACAKNECPCDTPVGSIVHGSTVTIYSKDSVACNEACTSFSEVATCNNGQLDKEVTGKHFRCRVEKCPDCSLGPNLIRSGDTVDTFSKAEVGCRESCEDFKQRRTCILGNLTGSDQFNQFSCKRKSCRCDLPDGSGQISLDGQVRLYSTQNAACGKTCDADHSQMRTCQMSGAPGSEIFALSGDSVNRFGSCQEATNCFCTLPNGLGVLAHGQIKKISKVETVQCAESCNSQPNVDVRCDNGIFRDNGDPTKIVDFSSATYVDYKYECRAESCVSCQVPGTAISVMHGQPYDFAKESSVGCDGTCEFKARTCNNGTFDGDTTYNKASCSKRTCVCAVPGNTGVEVPVGNTWPFYSAAQAQCGQTCAGIRANRTCTEVAGAGGTFTYQFQGNDTFTHGACQEPTACACALPGGLGQIQHGKTVSLTSQADIACGTPCDQVPSLSMKCENGVLVRNDDGMVLNTTDPAFPYKYYCNKPSCTGCSLRGYGSIPVGDEITLYSKGVMGCGDKPELFTYLFKCENSILLRNGQPYDSAGDPNAPAAWFASYEHNCPGCPLPWGGSIGVGSTVRAYKYFGTVVNGCGRGCKVLDRKCEAGVLSGDPSYDMQACDNSCTMEGGGAPPRACLLPWQNTFVTPDAEVPVFRKRVVGCGDSCANHMLLARCDMETGTLRKPAEYLYGSCVSTCP